MTLDLREEFRRAVVTPFVRGYARGETPNPCIRCNGGFRFAELLSFAAANRRGGARDRSLRAHRRARRAAAARARARPRRRIRATCSRASTRATSSRIRFPLGDADEGRDARRGRSRAGSPPRGAPRARRRASSQAATTARSSTATGSRSTAGRDRRRGGRRRSASTTATGGSRPASAAGLGVAAAEPLYALVDRCRARTRSSSGRGRRSPARAISARGRLFAPADRVDGEAPLPLAGGRARRSSRRRPDSGSGSTSRPTAWPAARRLCSTTATWSSVPGWSRRPPRARLCAVVVAFSFGDLADLALAVFLVAVGVGLSVGFSRLAVTFDRLSSLIRGAEREVLPVINKVGGSVDRVNAQLDKLDTATDSAVDAVRSRRRSGPRRQLRRQASRAEARRASRPASRTAGRRCERAATGATPSPRPRRRPARREHDLDEELKATARTTRD